MVIWEIRPTKLKLQYYVLLFPACLELRIRQHGFVLNGQPILITPYRLWLLLLLLWQTSSSHFESCYHRAWKSCLIRSRVTQCIPKQRLQSCFDVVSAQAVLHNFRHLLSRFIYLVVVATLFVDFASLLRFSVFQVCSSLANGGNELFHSHSFVWFNHIPGNSSRDFTLRRLHYHYSFQYSCRYMGIPHLGEEIQRVIWRFIVY